jgi:hypothetical protein
MKLFKRGNRKQGGKERIRPDYLLTLKEMI